MEQIDRILDDGFFGFQIRRWNHTAIGDTQQFMITGDLQKSRMRHGTSHTDPGFFIDDCFQQGRCLHQSFHKKVCFAFTDQIDGGLSGLFIRFSIDDRIFREGMIQLLGNLQDLFFLSDQDRPDDAFRLCLQDRFQRVLIMGTGDSGCFD